MSYIWHCPSEECMVKGTILFKTEKPFLLEGQIKCPKCEKLYSFSEIEKFNRKNIETYLKK